MRRRLLLWSGIDAWRAEAASAELSANGIAVSGTQLGIDPVPYRLDYRLDAAEGFITRSLRVEGAGEGWSRRLLLSHDGTGRWRCEAEQEGAVELPPPGGDLETVEGALDCDLALSPLTNLMPVRRHALQEQSGSADFLMAWVSVPDLSVHASRQRYEHVRADAGGAVVRYVSLDTHDGFTAELELDGDGLVLVYPQLARRVGFEPSP